MLSKRLIILAICFIICSGSVFVLNKMIRQIHQRANGFIRLFPPHRLTPIRSIDIGFNSYYLSGYTGHQLFLGNYTVPDHVLKTSLSLDDTGSIDLKLPRAIGSSTGNLTVQIDSPRIYFKLGKVPAILQAGFGEQTINNRLALDSHFFSACILLSPTSCILRSYNRKLQQHILLKLSNDGKNQSGKSFLLEKQDEGFFSTDGILYYEPGSSSVIYVYRYRNEFLRLDSNLNLIYKARTIDTNSIAKINVSAIKSENLVTFAKPPVMVNRQACADSGYILVNSALRANNEMAAAFAEHSVFDAYRLRDGKYRFSFYTSKLLGKEIRECAVYQKKFYILSDRYLLANQVNF